MNTHRDYEPFELPENMEEDIGLFQAAFQPRCDALDSRPIRSVMAVTDASNQEATVRSLAPRVASRLGARLTEIACGDDTARLLERTKGADLLVVPFPCGEDIDALRSQSLGSIADGLLQSCPTAMLCVRDPLSPESVEPCLDTILVAIAHNDAANWQALSWAFRLAQRAIVILEWVDRDAIAEASQLLEGRAEMTSVQQSIVERAVTSRLGPLVGAAQRLGVERNLSVHVEFRFGSMVEQTLEVCKEFDCGTLVIARSDDRQSLAFHLVQDVLLASRGLTLVI